MSASQQSKRKAEEQDVDSPCKQPKRCDSPQEPPHPPHPANAPPRAPAEREAAAMDLSAMNDTARQQYYETLFRKQVEPLHGIKFPSLAAQYPRFASEICAAYLRHTIFTVSVWINYDRVVERFYYDARADDCGLLRLTPKQVQQCLRPFEFGRIRFEVRTPFALLASVTVAVMHSKKEGGVRIQGLRIRWSDVDDRLFEEVMRDKCKTIVDEFELSGTKGMNYDDVVRLAECFLIVPEDDEVSKSGWLVDTNVWMNFEREKEYNMGYVADLPEV